MDLRARLVDPGQAVSLYGTTPPRLGSTREQVANAIEKLRVMEIFLPSAKVVVLSGHDAERNLTRVISSVDALQLVAKVMKVPPGAKPARVGLIMPKPKDSTG